MSSLGIAIPTYNRQEQLESLLETIPEHIPTYISDNGSCLTESFRKKFPQARVSAVTGNIITMFENWNRAARLVSQDWIIIPSDDDIYYPQSFETVSQYLDRYAQADMIVFGHNVVDENYRIIGRWVPKTLDDLSTPSGFKHFKYGVDARMPSIIFRRSLLEAIGFFDEEFMVTAADSYMIQRASLLGRTVFVPLIISGYRVWTQGTTHGTISTQAWLKEIVQWGDKLEQQLKKVPMYASEIGHIRSEIYARNLHAGLSHLRNKGFHLKAVRHFLAADFPWQATLLTRMKLIYQLIKFRM